MTRRQILLAFLPPLLFGTGFTIAKPVVTHFPPLFMMLIIYGGIAIVLSLSHRELLKTPLAAIIAISAFAVTIQGALMFSGLRGMPATAANLILQIQIPFAVLLDWLIGGEKLNFRRTLGMTIAFVGVALVIGLPEEPPPLVATALIVAGGFCWALGQTFARKYGRDSGIGLLKANALGSLPQLALATLLFEQGQMAAVQSAGPVEWLMLCFVGVVGYYLAYIIWYSLLRQCRMDEVAPFILLMPVVGIVTAFIVLGEIITPAQVAGGLVILAGLALVSGVEKLIMKKAGPQAQP
ncbi:MAG: hypothetical protein FJX63_03170 [Alphaproteobacteria bacterium]|nr:hypothetical protein [Alphaproteobacteria bacterium]